jgi:hypothetical protein
MYTVHEGAVSHYTKATVYKCGTMLEK